MRFFGVLAVVVACRAPEPEPKSKPTDDTGTPTATGPTTGGTTPSGHRGERFTLTSGEVVQGEVIATYDQRQWMWTPADDTWFAVFDGNGWGTYPTDASVRVIRESEIGSREEVQLAGPTYFERLRSEGIVWSQPPIPGTSWVITGNDRYHLEEDGFGDFAWDLVKTDGSGARFLGAGADNADYLVWGQPVQVALGGTVVEVVRDGVDNPPGAYPPGAVNNLVGVHVGGQFYQYYLHMQQGSIPPEIAVGSTVAPGDSLGVVGNSGVTLEPHLHITLHYWENAVPGRERYWSVPSEWTDLHVSDEPTASGLVDFAVPQTGDWVGRDAF